MPSKKLSDLRREFGHDAIDERHWPATPFPMLTQWIEEAIQHAGPDANAMCLSTVSSKGFPSARYVLLKDFDEKGFVFFTQYHSRKGKHLKENPAAALTFYWAVMERQLRVEGSVEKISREESAYYFSTRPLESRINAIISPQSEEIPDRNFLEKKQKEARALYVNQPPLCPANWGGFRLAPVYIEFWQGGPHRLHDRIVYCKFEENWKRKRLAP